MRHKVFWGTLKSQQEEVFNKNLGSASRELKKFYYVKKYKKTGILQEKKIKGENQGEKEKSRERIMGI
jgi:hypothetical protein